jgi:hypothetical protein
MSDGVKELEGLINLMRASRGGKRKCKGCAYECLANGYICFHPSSSVAGPIVGISQEDAVRFTCKGEFFEPEANDPLQRKVLHNGQIVTAQFVKDEEDRVFKEKQQKELEALSNLVLDVYGPLSWEAFPTKFVPKQRKWVDHWLAEFMADFTALERGLV